MPPQPNVPPTGPAPVAGPPATPAGPSLQLQSDLQAITAHARQIGVPPPLVQALLDYLARQAGPRLPQVFGRLAQLAPQELTQLIQEFAQTPMGQAALRRGGAGNGVPTGVPDRGVSGGVPAGVAGGAVGGAAPVAMPLGGPPPQAAPGAAPERPGPPPVDEADLPPPGVPEEEQVGKPEPWPFAEAQEEGPPKPTLELVESLSARARRRGEPRNQSIQAQQDVFYRRKDRLKLNGQQQVNEAEDEHVFVRSAPVRRFDRTVELVEPNLEVMRLQKRARRRDDGGVTAQKIENFVRAQWALHARDWQRERVPHGEPPLPRKMGGLATGHGGLGFMLRKNDLNRGDHPFTYIPIPVTELHAVDDWVLRITELPLADARAAEPDIRKAFPKKSASEARGDEPDDSARVRLVSGGDIFGRWHFKFWEWGNPGTATGTADDPSARWLKEPTEINYPGFGIYQGPFYWNATPLPELGQDTDQRARAVARGIYAAELDDLSTMDRLLGITIALAEKVVSPDMTTFYDPARGTDEATGLDIVPPSYDSRPGSDNKLRNTERREYGGQSAQGAAAIGTALSFLNSEQADAQPPAMSGLGRDASGFQSVVRQEAGQTLHVDPMRRFFREHMAYVDECLLALCWQFGQGEEKRWTKYRVVSDQGDDTFTAADIALEGPVVTWSYREDNEPLKAGKQRRLLELHTAGGLPMEDVLDELGYEEPEVKQKAVLAEKLMKLPWVEQTLAFWEIAKKRNKSLTMIAWHALQNMPGGPPKMPGMASQPAPPGPARGPQAAPTAGMPDPAAGAQLGQGGGPLGGQ